MEQLLIVEDDIGLNEIFVLLCQLFRCDDIVHRNISFRCFYGTAST